MHFNSTLSYYNFPALAHWFCDIIIMTQLKIAHREIAKQIAKRSNKLGLEKNMTAIYLFVIYTHHVHMYIGARFCRAMFALTFVCHSPYKPA